MADYFMREKVAGAPTISMNDDSVFPGLRIYKVSGLEKRGGVKNIHVEDYVENDEVSILYPIIPAFSQTEISINCLIAEKLIPKDDDGNYIISFQQAKYNALNFFANKFVLYWDTYRNMRADLYRDSEIDIEEDVCHGENKHTKFTVKYKNTRGRCELYDINNLLSTNFVVNIPTDNFSLNRIFFGNTPYEDFYVNWGDGVTDHFLPLSDTQDITHTYDTAGTYTIKMYSISTSSTNVGVMPFVDIESGITKDCIIECHNPLQVIYDGYNIINDISFAFLCECHNVTNVDEDYFKYNNQLIDISGAFKGSKISIAPSIDTLINLEYADNVFSGCSNLTNIPVSYFKNNISLLSISGIFEDSALSNNFTSPLFENNLLLEDFSDAFAGTNITIGDNFFTNSNIETFFADRHEVRFNRTFFDIAGGTAPLLHNCIGNIITHSRCFTLSNVTNIDQIPTSWGGNATSYSINVIQSANGSISPVGNAGVITVLRGMSYALHINANIGYKVSKLIIDGVETTDFQGISNVTYYFNNITSDHTISAVFEIIMFSIVTRSNGNGTITPSMNVFYGSNFTVVFTPDLGYAFSSVVVDGVALSYSTNNSYTFTNVRENHTIEVNFAENYKFSFDCEIPQSRKIVLPMYSTDSFPRVCPDENVFIDWGDGTQYTVLQKNTLITKDMCTHTYVNTSNRTISIWSENSSIFNPGKLPKFGIMDNNYMGYYNALLNNIQPYVTLQSNVLNILQESDCIVSINTPMPFIYNGNEMITDYYRVFAGMTKLTHVCNNLLKYVSSSLKSIKGMFYNDYKLIHTSEMLIEGDKKIGNGVINVNASACFAIDPVLNLIRRKLYENSSYPHSVVPDLWNYDGISESSLIGGASSNTKNCYDGIASGVKFNVLKEDGTQYEYTTLMICSNSNDIPNYAGGNAIYNSVNINCGYGGSYSPAIKQPNYKLKKGTSMVIYFIPFEGYKVKNVKVNNQSHGYMESYTINSQNQDVNIDVEFEKL